MIPICTSVPRPTDPGLRTAGGSGFDAIWCAASVIPYASSTGAPNASSSACITRGGSAALQDLMKRSRSVPAGRRGAGRSQPGGPARRGRRGRAGRGGGALRGEVVHLRLGFVERGAPVGFFGAAVLGRAGAGHRGGEDRLTSTGHRKSTLIRV